MSQPYIGEIRMFGGNFAPANWAFCDGALLSIASNQTLFALIGTTYGGDGVNTYGLPNLQGRLPISQGQGPGLSPYTLGQAGGTETVTLTTNQIPQHNHFAVATTTPGTTSMPGTGVIPATATGHSPQLYIRPGAQALNVAPMSGSSLGVAGGSQSHDNMMPYLCVSFIIALYGIFPSQN